MFTRFLFSAIMIHKALSREFLIGWNCHSKMYFWIFLWLWLNWFLFFIFHLLTKTTPIIFKKKKAYHWFISLLNIQKYWFSGDVEIFFRTYWPTVIFFKKNRLHEFPVYNSSLTSDKESDHSILSNKGPIISVPMDNLPTFYQG